MKLLKYLILSSAIIFSIHADANVTDTKEWKDLKKFSDQMQQKQKDLESGKTSKANDRNIIKGWECRDMENGGSRLIVIDRTGIAKMNNIPSTEAAAYGTKRPTSSLPRCELDLVVPKLKP